MERSKAREILFHAYWHHTIQAENLLRQEDGLPELTPEAVEEQFAKLLDQATSKPYAAVMNAGAVRDELDGAGPEAHDLTEAQAEAIKELPDEEICDALADELDDYFWETFNTYRRAAITRLSSSLTEAPAEG